MTSASRYGTFPVKPYSSALVFPSTKMRTMLFCILITCLISARIPILYRSSIVGLSVWESLCVTRKISSFPIIACSTALIERSLLMSKCAIIPGRIVMPRRATAGTVITMSLTRFSFTKIQNAQLPVLPDSCATVTMPADSFPPALKSRFPQSQGSFRSYPW